MGPLALPLIASGISFLGGMFGNKNKNKQQSTQSGTTTTAAAPLAPEYAALQSAIMPSIMKRLSSSTNMKGFQANGIGDINRTYDLGKLSVDNNITARGLGTSPIAGAAMTRNEMGRIGEVSQFNNNIPLIQRQMQDQDMESALRMLNFGRSMTGQTTTSNQSGTYTGGGPGALAGGLDNMASMMGFLIGNGAFGSKGGTTPYAPGKTGNPYGAWPGVPYA